MIKVVLCGPPQCGKSVLREGLKSAVSTLTGGTVYCYVITANPDGEGAWFQPTTENDREQAMRLKTEYKQSLRGDRKTAFTSERVAMWEAWVQNTTGPLTLVDIGGRIDEANRRICQNATHAIILGRDDTSLTEWGEFCASLNLVVIARLLSDYHGLTDDVDSNTDPLTGKLRRLERGQSIAERPAVIVIAERVVATARRQEQEYTDDPQQWY